MKAFLNWFLSRTVRHARQMCGHADKLISAQRDLLTPSAISAVQQATKDLYDSTRGSIDRAVIEQKMTVLNDTAEKWLKRYPHASYRENVEVFLVAIAVAMGIRTFLLQPFKIPTGSMQPTLYGVTAENRPGDPTFVIPGTLKRWWDFISAGATYYHIVARNDGEFSLMDEQPSRFLLFNLRQRFKIGDEVYTVWFPPENLFPKHAQLGYGVTFRAGQDVLKMRAVSGDHLFVDRMTYNFRRPTRGDIVVFKTYGIKYRNMSEDQHYIKRLVALGGEKIQIGNDRHAVINGKRLDSSTPHFEKIYDESKWAEDGYMGHVNARFRPSLGIPLFPDGDSVLNVPEDHYFVMGDHTCDSSDSRYWGTFPKENVIGKSFFVYWPFGKRFGWWGHD
ncbi:MAG: signal peptidase I [Verrucomicrobiales bacterium]|nr:signal peptidase I [Verrucomicrobiales bacterium]